MKIGNRDQIGDDDMVFFMLKGTSFQFSFSLGSGQTNTITSPVSGTNSGTVTISGGGGGGGDGGGGDGGGPGFRKLDDSTRCIWKFQSEYNCTTKQWGQVEYVGVECINVLYPPSGILVLGAWSRDGCSLTSTYNMDSYITCLTDGECPPTPPEYPSPPVPVIIWNAPFGCCPADGGGGDVFRAVVRQNGVERYRSESGGGFSFPVEAGDSIEFSTEGSGEKTADFSLTIQETPASSETATP